MRKSAGRKHKPSGWFLLFSVSVFTVATCWPLFSFSVPARAQTWGTSEGLLQGERLARVTTLLNDTLRAETDTTAWLPFGTHIADLADERIYAPTRFTLFVHADTSGGIADSGPEITISAQIALSDTTGVVYEQRDGSLELVPDSSPIKSTIGQIIPIPVYGGGWIRLVVASDDTAVVKCDMWRVR